MKPWFKWLLSVANAIVLLVLTAFWLNTNYSYGDERLLVQWSSILKRVILNIDEDPPKEDFLFINLAYEKALIPTEDGLGREVITDRAKLAQFFAILRKHQNGVKFTVCDVFLKGESENDSLFASNIKDIKNVVFPNHHTEDGTPDQLSVEVPQAIADYKMASGGFLKFKLFQDEELSTIPVYMYEKINGKKIADTGRLYREGEHLSFNSVIIDYQIRSHEVFEQNEYPVVNLSELLLLPEEVIVGDFLKNRIVLMGDFQNDVHSTILGSMPGTLILLNAYLTLAKGYHLISWTWLSFILTGYLIFSRLMLFPAEPKHQLQSSKWLGPLLGSITYLSILSILSYLFFNIHIQVLILTLYITLLRFIVSFQPSQWTSVRFKDWGLQLRETYFKFK